MPAAVPLAIVGGSIASGVIGNMGAKSAADTQAQATQSQIAEQNYQFNTIRDLLKPYVTAGQNSLTGYDNAMGQYEAGLGRFNGILDNLNNLTGANGNDAQQTAINGLTGNPLYTTSMKLGQQAILANASATGGLRGGNTIASLGYLPNQILSNVMQSQIGNLGTSLSGTATGLNAINSLVGQYGNLANLGENAAAGTGQAASNTGNNITSLIGQGGAIGAGATLAGTNAFTGALNNIMGTLPSMMSSFGGGGGSMSSLMGINPLAFMSAGGIGGMAGGNSFGFTVPSA